jgi:hypothetical protein
MSRSHPGADCVEVTFTRSLVLPEGAEVALEDYARALTRSEAVEVLPGNPGGQRGVHLCRPVLVPREEVLRDLEAFAQDLEARSEGSGGLGWS